MSSLVIKLRKPLAFVQRDFLIAISYRFQFLSQVLGTFVAILTLFFLSKMLGSTPVLQIEKYGGDYFSFVIIGFAFSNYLGVALNSLSKSIRDAQMTGTLEALLVTQTSIPTIIVSSSLYSFLITSVHVIIFLMVGTFAFGVDLSSANLPAAFLTFALTITSFSSLGIISASFIMIMKRGNPVNWLFTTLSWLLGGVYYPVSVLPDWLQKISVLLPMTHALEAMRLALLKGNSIASLSGSLVGLGAFSAIVLPAGILFFQFAIKQAKVHGSLTQY